MNYFKLKEDAKEESIYMKKNGQMVFMALEDTDKIKYLLSLLDKKDEEIKILNSKTEKLDNAVRIIESALQQRGVLK